MSRKKRKKPETERNKGWRAVDLSEPPKGPLQRSVTSMRGAEEPEWPKEQDDTPAVDDEGDIEK